ncbi:MAG: class I SAM-dependent methyltransferase [Chloroflexota bacterium]
MAESRPRPGADGRRDGSDSKKTYSVRLALADRVRGPAIRQAIAGLSLVPGSVGLDAGCGTGQHSWWLAEEIGSGGRVVGLDRSAENMAVAGMLAPARPNGGQVDFVNADLHHLPFKDGSFDWAWCCDTLWPVVAADSPVEVVRRLTGAVKPGGTLALAYWSDQCLLSGYPALEARLNNAFVATTPYLAGVAPGLHFLRAMGWLQVVGLQKVTATSYVAEWRAPFSTDMSEAVAYCFEMFWGGVQPHVSKDDWEMYLRLCTPSSDDFILLCPDYYGFLTYTVFSGRVPL